MKIVFDTNFWIDYLKGMENTTQTESANMDNPTHRAASKVCATMSTLELLVLDGRGGGDGFCRACDRVEALGLSDADGCKTDLGYAVLAYAKATGEI